MGLQVPHCVRAQATAESHLRPNASITGCNLSRAGSAKGVSNYRGALNAGPCPYVYRDSAQASGGISDRVLKGKSAIAIARLSGKERNFSGEHFWARGYAVSTVGFELEQVRTYIREQDAADGTGGQF